MLSAICGLLAASRKRDAANQWADPLAPKGAVLSVVYQDFSARLDEEDVLTWLSGPGYTDLHGAAPSGLPTLSQTASTDVDGIDGPGTHAVATTTGDWNDWFAHAGQLAYLPDFPGSDQGLSKVTAGITYIDDATDEPVFDYRVISAAFGGTPWAPQQITQTPDNSITTAAWASLLGSTPTTPIAVGRAKNGATAGAVVFKDGLIGISGSGNDPNSEVSVGYPAIMLGANKVPTAIAVTRNNEFALVTCWDTSTETGHLAVIAIEGYPPGQADLGHFIADQTFWGLPNWPGITNIKLLGYVDLPIKAPISVATGCDWSSTFPRGSLENEPFSLAAQAERDRWLANNNNMDGILRYATMEMSDIANEFDSIEGSAARSTTQFNTGTGSLRVNPSGIETGVVQLIFHNIPLAFYPSVFARTYFRIATAPASASEEILTFALSTSFVLEAVRLTSSRTLAVYDGELTLRGTGATVLALNTWYLIECSREAVLDTSVRIVVRIEGATEIDVTWADDAVRCDSVEIGKSNTRNNQAMDLYYDDIAISSTGHIGTQIFELQHKRTARAGYAVVGSRSENTVVFLDLQPLFQYYRSMYLTTTSNYNETQVTGPASNQWPYAFSFVSSQMPIVISTHTIHQPTSLVCGHRAGVNDSIMPWPDDPFKSHCFVGTVRHGLYVYDVHNLIEETSDLKEAPTIAFQINVETVGRNLVLSAHNVQPDLSLVAGGDVLDEMIVLSRGDHRITKFSGNDGSIVYTFQDSRMEDPVGITYTVEQRIGASFAHITVCDFDGKQVINYVTQLRETSGYFEPLDSNIYFGHATDIPGKPITLSLAEVP